MTPREHMGQRVRRAAVVVLSLVVLTLLAAEASATVYQFYDGVTDPPPAYPVGGDGIVLFTNSWGAQSFQAGTNYTLARVDLWAMENGGANDSATVEVRQDNAGSPNMVAPPLASAAATAPATYGWVSFNVAPNVLLLAGTTYWVVLETDASSGNRGWTWWNTANDTFIEPGQGELSSSAGASWSPAPGDFAVRTFGYLETHMQVALTVDRSEAPAGDVVTYAIYFNNTGGVPASSVSVTDILPSGLSYLSDNATASSGTRVDASRWTFANVAPGVHYFLLKASIGDELVNQSLLVNRVDLAYSDFRGVSMPGSSAAITFTVTDALGGGGGPLGLLPYVLFAAIIGWIFLAGLWPRGQLEDVFLVDNGGTLVAHLSRADNHGIDQDIFVGMLTAVQAFVRDSFASVREGELKRMDFGARKIYLGRGRQSYLAAVLNGRTPPTLRWRMRRTLDRIEEAYGDILAHWSGDTKSVEGTEQLLTAGLLR